jgi:hypothetical protein
VLSGKVPSFVISGWAKADSSSLEPHPSWYSYPEYQPAGPTPTFGIEVKLESDYDREYMEPWSETFFVPFNPETTAWQYASLGIAPNLFLAIAVS